MDAASSSLPTSLDPPPLDRRDKLFFGLDQNAAGLEIGGSYNPLCTAPNVKHLDYQTTAALREHYAREGRDVSVVPTVSFVMDGRSYKELTAGETFDWIVASHVIEHVSDLVGWLNDCASILKTGGVLSLAIPDKRFMFDYFRPQTGLARIIDASGGKKAARPSLGAVLEHNLSYAMLNGEICWHPGAQGVPTPGVPMDYIRQVRQRWLDGEYFDVHVWAFTPNSLRLIIEDLYALGLIRVREVAFFDVSGCEFFLQLTVDGPGPGMGRQELAQLARLDELAIS
ncbi:class I SAM-dependent methyltransferase [Brevundimonas diminuta]|uniref:class I SAM-dependent methyltransferase n=1 Tax=Brevundimonas diminuta TaxID=293 RepID=UPI0025A50885|nr:class I SAM-dependent methyltransferase [Brevundimonas diminuta]MDM8352905.1 class I SAM-dependent methyltransferase [Brevundimonas diminuta]